MKRKFLPALVLLSVVLLLQILPPALPRVEAQEYGQLVRIESLTRSLSQEEVQPGEPFYALIQARVTFLGDINVPFTVEGRYEVFGLMEGQKEIVLGQGERRFGPANIKAGDTMEVEERIPLVFSSEAALGGYEVLIRPVQVSPWYFWLAFSALLPRSASLGRVRLASPATPTAVPATPTPSPTLIIAASPTPLPTPSPTPILAASPTPLPTPSPTPTLAPMPTAVPTPFPTVTPTVPAFAASPTPDAEGSPASDAASIPRERDPALPWPRWLGLALASVLLIALPAWQFWLFLCRRGK